MIQIFYLIGLIEDSDYSLFNFHMFDVYNGNNDKYKKDYEGFSKRKKYDRDSKKETVDEKDKKDKSGVDSKTKTESIGKSRKSVNTAPEAAPSQTVGPLPQDDDDASQNPTYKGFEEAKSMKSESRTYSTRTGFTTI